ncbi:MULTISPECIES: hypothetical protein [Pyrobaculum]|uniref:Uncharacterized protein n=2 Tax=Pyrobaculum arsenaticum TaxID=121277 RepID=A4WI16_PYRAR|nr:hypothetical protein [Pyrobaculum arsenaticum]ABP50033.1 hypothetical protein Pars_0434 [Pyrobaculum arsenaticum DSM 13514]MCY0890199.1 hypothetical protein [Pyrobaculum arsenaticum]NYR14999.1 hypothetical protein [Pyrobaculum arsenaticum]
MPTWYVVLMILTGLLIGAGVPVALFYMALNAGSWVYLLAATIISVFAVVGGGILAIVGFVPVLQYMDEAAEEAERQLAAHRAFLRSLLEELDEASAVLRDIRDELRRVGGT